MELFRTLFQYSRLIILSLHLLSMTRRTTRQFFNFVFLHQFFAQCELIRRRLIIHAEHVLARSHETLRRAVAFQAPVHIERVFPPHQRHLIDPAMASGAAHSLVDMNAMIEINKTGKIVNAGPLDRLAGAKTVPDRRQRWAIRPDLAVTVHAGFRRRNAGKGTFLDGSVAVSAIDAFLANVMFMTEWNGLAARHPNLGDVGRFVDRRQRCDKCDEQEQAAKDTDPRNGVGARMKYLSHRPILTLAYCFS